VTEQREQMTARSARAAESREKADVAASAAELDGALFAIVAADRLALADELQSDEALLRRRLTLFYGYFAALIGLSWVASLLSEPPPGWSGDTLLSVLLIEGALIFTLGAAFAALRLGVRRLGLLRALDLVASIATALAMGTALGKVPGTPTVDASAIAFFVLFFVLRAALVPSRPWFATLLTALCAVPFALGLAVMYRDAGPIQVPDPADATSTGIANLVAALGGVFIVSRTFYGLRGTVERAVKLGQYVVHEKIGEGGMGAVYRASHAMLKRPTAIKLITPGRAGDTATARFEREVLAASRLSHPNNVAIYDFGRTRGGAFYYAMELLDGEDLGKLVEREGPQSERRTLHLLRQVAAALAEAHAAGLVHRDIKPENIMRCARGNERDFIKVLDFGLVKDAATSGDVKLTHEGAIAGTPLYMAPESIVAPETVGPAADSYAVGCVAYFLLTGRPPFEGKHLVEVCAQHVHGEVPPPSARARRPVSAALDALVLACLAKQPAARPTMAEIHERLAPARSSESSA
jgi:eukaryotic-like serine/threonine-protein kinase